MRKLRLVRLTLLAAQFSIFTLSSLTVFALPGSTPDASPFVEGTAALSAGHGAVSPDQARNLFSDFARAQKKEVLDLDKKNQAERRDLESNQNARRKVWENQERDARHKFFDEHPLGPDRRAYVKDFISRRNVFLKLLADERTQRIHDQDVTMNALKQDQVVKLREFQEFINRGDRPPQRLWPVAQPTHE
jgi:hypothetical protein